MRTISLRTFYRGGYKALRGPAQLLNGEEAIGMFVPAQWSADEARKEREAQAAVLEAQARRLRECPPSEEY